MSNPGKQQHPLQQIAESATHKLLLKQWLKEEEFIAGRVTLRESRLDGVRREITALCCAFFLFHSILILLLFQAAADAAASACRRSWIPCLLSLTCSTAMAWAIRYKADAERHVERLLEREVEDGRLLARCVEELKRKGVEFDLLKEVDALRRAKSLRVEAGDGDPAAARRWSAKDFTAMFFFLVSCAVLGLTRFVLCH
ncbi:hypothetical protein Taro_034118 [Colocasia esculenta]|uniref:Uncharacterized protein n=1 Tax=Colocasia esculenta TaxID=4460 RepID=A0A843WB01_COLES|nr:hypothetical protein [Colocasia esculenta]